MNLVLSFVIMVTYGPSRPFNPLAPPGERERVRGPDGSSTQAPSPVPSPIQGEGKDLDVTVFAKWRT